MEEKINNQKIFRYVPSLIARLIIKSNLQDKNIFTDAENTDFKTLRNSIRPNLKNTFLTTSLIKTNIYPIDHPLKNTIVMNIRLKGFGKLISTLSIKDPKAQKEKMMSEYLSIITPKILLKISKIISNNGGEIIKYNDYEFTTIWNFFPKKGILQRFKKFYAKKAILTACQIKKQIDGKEITSGVKIKISIGIAMGETSIIFFGGERKRGEYIVMGETIQRAEICLNYCLNHEVIISKEVNDLFIGSEEINTKEIENEENINLFLITYFDEDLLKNFRGFKITMKSDKLKLTKSVYENLAKKVYIFSSILPQGLVKYLDVDQDENLKEINVVTIATIHIKLNKKILNNLKQVQNIILDIQKATYLTFGSLLYISKTYNGLLIRCVWGMDPGSFLDDTARAITTAILIGSLTEHYEIKIGIGITTGSCFTGLISIQGDRKQFTLLGEKVNLSRILADDAFQKVIDKNIKRNYCIYCDKKTMNQSQKWFRYMYVSEIRIYFNKDSQELYYENKNDLISLSNRYRTLSNLENTIESKIQFKEIKKNIQKNFEKRNNSKLKSFDKKSRNNTSLLGEFNRQNIPYFKNGSNINERLNENTQLIRIEIYTPVEFEEYFIPSSYDLFPLIRTHKHNSYSPKIRQCFYNHLENVLYGNKINLNGINNLPIPIYCSQEDKKKMEYKFNKSNTIFGYENEIEKMVNTMNFVTTKNKKQLILIKGPVGVGKSLFLRKSLNNYLEQNKELRDIFFNEDEFIFCNKMNPLVSKFPYNTFCFILRKLFLHLKRLKLLKELYENTKRLNLDNENIKSVNFVLSFGKKDIDIKEEFERALKQDDLIKSLKDKDEFKSSKNIIQFTKRTFSIISELEGPYKMKDSNKINIFFYEMINIYKKYLNDKYNKKIAKTSLIKNKNKVPLILVIDDVHLSERNSIDFIKYLFNDDSKSNNPFIIILVEQTPFNKNYSPLIHRELEFFFSYLSELDENNKIICFEIKPFFEKEILQKIIIENFNNYVIKNYDYELKKIDEKILDFLLMKSFQGNPLLVITLFESLLKSQKYVKICENECKITKELIDDNEVYDWSNLLIPYIYEKITSMMINSLLNFKETLLLKYACTIGTMFDIQTLDKINPLNLIIKSEDLYNIMQKLFDEYIIEIFDNEQLTKKSKKFLICKICFPFMREVLHQKFPIETRASLHAVTAKLLTGGKKMYYVNSKLEGKILRRHLIYSEIDVIQEVESKIGKIASNTYKNTKIMNLSNLTVIFVKDICARIFDRKFKNVIEGNIEMKIDSKWIKVSYFIDRSWKLYINKKNDKNDYENEIELKVPIKDIYKNTKLNDGKVLELIITEYSFYLENKYKEKFYFYSDKWEDIFYIDTAITFLKVIANYEKYIYNFGYTQFPVYKPGWFSRKEKKYYANIEKNQISYFDNLNPNRKKRLLSSFGLENRTDRLINESKDLKKPFSVLMHTTFTLIIAKIQGNLSKINDKLNNEEEEHRLIQGKTIYLMYVPITKHIRKAIQKYLDDFAQKEKEEEELRKMRKKNKYSFLPLRLLKEERRILGGGIDSKRRNQSICEIKPFLINKEEKDKNEGKFNRKEKKSKTYKDFVLKKIQEKEEKMEKEKVLKEEKVKKEEKVPKEENEETEDKEDFEFVGRRRGKSRTILERKELPKEVVEKLKCETSIEFIDNYESDSGSLLSKSNENNDDNSFNFSESSQKSESSIKENKTNNNNIVNINKNNEIENNDKINNYNVIRKSSFKNKINNNNKNKFTKFNINDNTLTDNNMNYNKKNSNFFKNNFIINNSIKQNNNNNVNINNINQTNINSKNNYNINNYINNHIHINVIDNNYFNKNMKKSFINSKSLKNINDLRMSYQKEMNKFRPKSNSTLLMKKYNSEIIKSFKEKYLNNVINYYHSNSSNKVSFNESDEDSILSEKESENTDSNNIILITTPVNKKKKNSRASIGISPLKDDIFSKALIAILGEDTENILFPIKNDYYSGMNKGEKNENINNNINNKNNLQNNINKISFRPKKSCNFDEPKALEFNPIKVKKKRSSLMAPSFKFQFKNKNKHVTFTENYEIPEELPEEKPYKYNSAEKRLIRKGTSNNNNNEKNIKNNIKINKFG